jgi:hypothetical protein
MKILAYSLIIIGSLFTIGMVYITFTVNGWFDIIIGWLFLGPLPLGIGIYILKKMKMMPILTFFSKPKNR